MQLSGMKVYQLLFLILSLLFWKKLPDIGANDIRGQFRFKHLTIDEGLSNNRTTDVVKDAYGFIWIATDDGVSRFDGTDVKLYNTYCNNLHDQYNQQITSVFSDMYGNLFKGSLNLFIYNRQLDKFDLFFPDTLANQPHRTRFMEQSPDGWIWIGARNGLFKLDPKTKETIHYPPDAEKGYYEIWALTVYDNKVWLGTRRNGLVMLDLSDGSYHNIPLINELGEPVSVVMSVYADKYGTIWAGTKSSGLFKINASNQKVVAHEYPDASCKRIRRIVEDKSGNLWLGTMEGLYLKKKGDPGYIRYAHAHHEFSSITHNSVFNIFIDDHNNIWLSTYAGGVNYSNMDRKPFVNYIEKENNPNYLNNGTVAGIAEDSRGNLYIGTDHGGLNVLDKKTGRFTYITHSMGMLTGTNIKCMVMDPMDRLWMGNYNGGINVLDTKTGDISYIQSDKNNPGMLSSNIVYSLAYDKNTNHMWVGTDRGVDRVDMKTMKAELIDYNKSINHVYCDREGRVWIGATGDGLYTFNPISHILDKFPLEGFQSFHWMLQDHRGQLWIGGKSGLQMVNLADSSMVQITKKDGLPSNLVFGIVEDDKDNLWVSTALGLAKCIGAVTMPNKPHIRTFTVDDGLQGNQFWRSAVYQNKQGMCYFGGTHGMSSFHPDSIVDNPFPPEIILTGLKIFNKDVEIGQEVFGQTVLQHSIMEAEKVELNHKHKVFTIEFKALHYANPLRNQYAYKLEPIEEEWNYAFPPRNFATYTFLPGGKYKFKVKAANSDGVWNDNPLTLNLVIKSPFWKTWYFFTLLALLAVTIGLALYQWRLARLKKQKEYLEFNVQQRTKEISFINTELMEQKEKLQELNNLKDKFFSIIAHDLKNPFQALMGFANLLLTRYQSLDENRKLDFIETISKSSVKIYNLLENLLTWSRSQTNGLTFNPEFLDLNNTVAENIKLMEEHSFKHQISINNLVKDNVNVFADRNMLDFIIRNLLNNAIKFSYASGYIYISLHETGDHFEIAVKDEGMGMNNNQLKSLFRLDSKETRPGTFGEKGTGLGLVLCKEFIVKHGGRIWAESETGKGSTFYFTLPKSS
jgi:signal transduction histidine kinase/ligand-binding sensor domain-containing protein